MKIITNVLLLILIFPLSLVAAEGQPKKYLNQPASYKDIQLLGNALSILQFVSMDDKDTNKFVFAALNGMAEALDRYSFFVPPDMIGSFMDSLKDKYVGIGIKIAKTDGGNIEIISTIPNGPAYKAGIKPKDVIISIDGKPVNEMRFIDSMRLIRSLALSPGSKVTLSILRKGNNDPLDFVLNREIIKPQIIEWKIPEKSYGYVRIMKFNKSTVPDFIKAITEIEKKDGLLRGLIIDLRNNPGGDTESAVEFSRLFLNSGIIASIDSNYPEFKVTFKADREPLYKWPLVIIVDEGSASASELFAGALQFNKRAKVVGRKTFGKSKFQSLLPLSNNSGLYVTLGKLYMPDGSSIEGVGLVPDIIIDKETKEGDMINKALEIIKNN